MKTRLHDYLLIALSVLLVLGCKTVFGPCPVKNPQLLMSCHYAGEAVFFAGVLLVVLGVLRLGLTPPLKKISNLAIGAVALVAMSFMGLTLQLCPSTRMHCHLYMKPFVIFMGLLLLVVALLDYFHPKSK